MDGAPCGHKGKGKPKPKPNLAKAFLRSSFNKHDDSDSDESDESDEKNDFKMKPFGTGLRGFGGLNLFGNFMHHNMDHKQLRTDLNVHFQTYNTNSRTSWEDRVRTFLQGVRHRPISDSEWRNYMSEYRNGIYSFASSKSTFTEDGLVTCRKWFEKILGAPMTDADFKMCVVDFYDTNSISHNDTDLHAITLVEEGGYVNKNAQVAFAAQTETNEEHEETNEEHEEMETQLEASDAAEAAVAQHSIASSSSKSSSFSSSSSSSSSFAAEQAAAAEDDD